MKWLRALIVIAAVALVLPAYARPGGGQTYSGSSSSSGSSRSSSSSSSSGYSSGSGSSSSGGDGAAAAVLIELLFAYPPLGIAVIGIVLFVAYMQHREKERSWDSRQRKLAETMEAAGDELDETRARGRRQGEMRAALEGIRKHDPNFSVALFEDFLYALYAEAHTARGNGTLERYAVWIGPAAQQAFASFGTGMTGVNGIVIGAMRYVAIQGVQGVASEIIVRVEFESNYSEHTSREERRFYAVENWVLARSRTARSKPADKARVFECPSCGAPLEALRGRECSYCNQSVGTGAFDWVVREIHGSRERRPPSLAGHTEEQGTDLPTVVDPEAKSRWEALTAKDPALDWEAFVARIELVFAKLQESWNAQDLTLARPFVSDSIFQTFSYWIDAYQRQKLRNYTENARIQSIRIARVTSDAVYDSVTVRVFATSLDFTLDADGRVAGGSRDTERRYSEYWTLIRGQGKRGAPRTDPSCPNCGAPLQIEMTGHCAHCRAKVTSGEFDWVLSRIEQDDSY